MSASGMSSAVYRLPKRGEVELCQRRNGQGALDYLAQKRAGVAPLTARKVIMAGVFIAARYNPQNAGISGRHGKQNLLKCSVTGNRMVLTTNKT
jgi:hypothetical protein